MAQANRRQSRSARPASGLRSHLYLLVAAALLPMLGIVLLTMWHAANRLREDSRTHLAEIASLLAHAVDRSILDHIANLGMLHEATAGDADTATLLWRRGSAAGLDTRVVSGHGAGTEPVPAALLEAARATGRPQVSGLFFRAEDPATPLVAIAVPGSAPDAPGAAVVLRSNHLIDTVATAAADQHLLVAVVDPEGRIAARSRNPERYLGQPVPDWDKLVALGTRNGVFEALSKEGQQVVFAFQMLEAAPGWALVVGEPLAAFQARWRAPLPGIGLGALLAAALGLLACHLLAGRILRPVGSLVRRAQLIIDGHDALPAAAEPDPPPAIRELATLQEGITNAEIALRRRADDARTLAASLDRSQRIYRTVAEAGALVFWQARPDGTISTGTGWPELTGQPESAALGRGWLRAVHPDDLPALDASWAGVIRSRGPFDLEFRVRDARGQWRWVRARGDRLADEDGGGWVGVLEDVDARRQAQEHIVYLARHDPLTGVANRGVLMERLAAAVAAARQGRHAALLCLDLDRFKEVNDTLGHPVGDALLRTVAVRLRQNVRGSDLVARLGGDEFAILLEPPVGREQVEALAGRLLETVQAPYDLDGHRVVVGASIGIAMTGDQAPTAERLLQNADLALYQVKHHGRGHSCFFDPGMDRRMQERRRLEMELREAVAAGQFEIHYQPRVCLPQRRLRGFEALLRWRHPERGLQAPDRFVPLLEEVGLMDQVDRWMLRGALQEALRWPEHLTLSVNLAGHQLDPGLDGWLLEELARAGFPPARLELEIDEETLCRSFTAAEASLARLKGAGISIVIDQFGTGSSSLSWLRSFVFDKVKFDPVFLQELERTPHGHTVIDAVSSLCARLGIAIGIEGVEREEQLALLGGTASDEAQGRLFGSPLEAGAVLELIRREQQAG